MRGRLFLNQRLLCRRVHARRVAPTAPAGDTIDTIVATI